MAPAEERINYTQGFPGGLDSLTAITPFDGRYRKELADLAPYTSELALFRARTFVEAQYLMQLSEDGIIREFSDPEKDFLTNLPNLGQTEGERIKTIEDETRHDVKAMERHMREQLEAGSLSDVVEWVHFGLTSEDINNIAYRLLFEGSRREVVEPTLDALVEMLTDRAEAYKDIPMLGRTHGQAAGPTTVGKEIAVFATRLQKQIKKLKEQQLTGKLNGAVGNYNSLSVARPDVDWISFSERFARRIGFEPSLYTTQINPYEDMIELMQNYVRINGVILDFNQDMWRYISDDWFVQEVRTGEVGSSAMPQKVNPISFENSESNLGTADALWSHFSQKLAISRLQRDLTDSSTIRSAISIPLTHQVLGYRNAMKGIKRVRPNEAQISADLNRNWMILTEAVQTILRREGVEDPYRRVAKAARGKQVARDDWNTWVDELSLDVTPEVDDEIRALSPDDYIGLTKELTDKAIAELRAGN